MSGRMIAMVLAVGRAKVDDGLGKDEEFTSHESQAGGGENRIRLGGGVACHHDAVESCGERGAGARGIDGFPTGVHDPAVFQVPA